MVGENFDNSIVEHAKKEKEEIEKDIEMREKVIKRAATQNKNYEEGAREALSDTDMTLDEKKEIKEAIDGKTDENEAIQEAEGNIVEYRKNKIDKLNEIIKEYDSLTENEAKLKEARDGVAWINKVIENWLAPKEGEDYQKVLAQKEKFEKDIEGLSNQDEA